MEQMHAENEKKKAEEDQKKAAEMEVRTYFIAQLLYIC
jgi:hypothetical protein